MNPPRPDFHHWQDSPLLTPQEEQALARRVHGDDPIDSLAARNELVGRNLRLITGQARRYTLPGLPMDDLLQEGVFGLIEAAEGYEPGRARFSTYAHWVIRKHLQQAAVDQGGCIRIPRRHLQHGDCDPATMTEITRVTRARARHAAGLVGSGRPMLHDRTYGNEGPHPITLLPARPEADPDDQEHREQVGARVRDAVALLPDREGRIIAGRFLRGEGARTLRQCGTELGITKERARQIQARALRLLRTTMGGDHVSDQA